MLAQDTFDIAIIGGGIIGIAHAYEAARRGLKVAVFERHPRPVGATVRNFGMIWPIGQAATTFERAMRSRATWLTLAREANFWAKPCGSLHLAYHNDELDVMNEFIQTTRSVGYQVEIWSPEKTVAKSKTVNPIGLKGAMWSATEVNIDPREATEKLQQYLRQVWNVTFFYQTAIVHVDYPYLSGGAKTWKANHIIVCSGADFETLYPEIYAEQPITKCKLQMLRTVPQENNVQLGPNLAAGLTLQHYASFAHCKSLVRLKTRFARDMAEYNKWGIHVLLSQTHSGELTIGDSHEYGLSVNPFDRADINTLILNYLQRFAKIQNPSIQETWHGVYAKLQNGATSLVLHPTNGVTIVNGVGGAGMTLSFGLAEEVAEIIGMDKPSVNLV